MLARPTAAIPAPAALARWLLVVAALVFAIVAVGGITRLTESGLSITEWKPIRGTLPPLTAAEWRTEFAAYQAIPQYRAFNLHMDLAGFKQIYFWEYVHRLLARTIGLALAAVLLVVWWRRAIPRGYGARILLILALGGLQGAIGWWMVASGLVHRTEVSHLRLAVHLLAAMLIFSVLVWTALDLRALARNAAASPARPGLWPLLAIAALAIQLVLGAFTAGLRAGYAFATWPLMGDRLFPEGGWNAALGPAANLASNPVAVQFVHRWWAWVVALAALLLASALRNRGAAAPAHAVLTLVAIQIALGIATLLTGVALPIAVLHQAVAALLLGAFVWSAHVLARSASAVRYSDTLRQKRRFA